MNTVRLYPVPLASRERRLGFRWRLVGRIRDYFYRTKREAMRDARFWQNGKRGSGASCLLY